MNYVAEFLGVMS